MADAETQNLDQEMTPDAGPPAPGDFLIVGVGASAGGLEAFGSVLKHMPPHPRIALVYVQHLAPDHESALVELLARDAQIPVQAVGDEAPVEPCNVYVIPPNTSLTIEGGVLRLGPRLSEAEFGKPIDLFLASLAEDQGGRAVGVVLSGTGSDGTAGLRAIREHGGMTVAQRPESAAYDSMPRSAIAGGIVDHVLSPDEVPVCLIEHVAQALNLTGEAPQGEPEAAGDAIARISAVVLRGTGHDFTDYKRNTFARRIHRRMDALQIESVADYARRIEEDPKEVRLLFQELLIGVTQFFRDPEAFDTLAQRVLPRLLEGKGADAQVRLWVVGCSSGEEVYSLAMLLQEQMALLAQKPRVQIFATDIDEEALKAARRGCYPESIREHVSQERLDRFFTREDCGYQVSKELRQMCVFSKHNVLHDPPFPELDLVSCRNLLIYLDSRVQGKVIGLFHYALRRGGFLFLGAAENIAGRPDLFEPVDRAQRVYQRREVAVRAPVEFPLASRPGREAPSARPEPTSPVGPEASLHRALERAVLDEYTPAGMVVREDGDVIYLFGPTGKYLAPSAGAPTLNAVSLVRKSLRTELRTALHKAARTHEPVAQCGLAVPLDAGTQTINLIVRPFSELGPDSGLYVVVFQEVPPPAAPAPGAPPAPVDEAAVQQLQYELRSTREQLQATIDELESANQELQSANEELLSMNEEMQSANEELQSSKEEVQSVNAELESVNTELTRKVGELDTARSDLESLFEGSQIATIFLDNDLRIKRFTPTATELFRLREGDVGRPVTDITARFANGDMVAEIREVLHTLQRNEMPVRRVDDDTRYLMRILPYRTRQNVIDGVVVSFVDVTELKRTEDALREAGERLREADRAKDDFIAMLSHELRNPLAAIAASIQLWRLRGNGDPNLERAREVGARQVSHMARLLDDLMDTSRISRGILELRRQPLDVRKAVGDAVEVATPRLEDRHQQITVSLPSEALLVEGDPARIQQVVGNLLDNAAKYTPVGGHVWVSAEAAEGHVVVRVRDDGIGMAPELLPRVFDLFVQAERRPDRTPGGLGLGLALVRRLVEMHGGTVEAHSEGEGKGSEFVVRLPLLQGSGLRAQGSEAEPPAQGGVLEGAAAAGSETRTPNPEPSGRRRILLVDDNADAAEVLGDLLETEGFEVLVAHDGPSALDLAAGYHPEVVLLDIGLPGMDGHEVARCLHEQGIAPGAVLIALTGYAQDEDIERSREARFAHHMAKPVNWEELKAALASDGPGSSETGRKPA